MRFIAGGLNGIYLRELAEQAVASTSHVEMAVSYASGDPQILSLCLQNNIRLQFWCRYDETVPVTLPILENFLDQRSPNYVCKMVPDIFHPKVIWWHDYGVYIGSANLTDRGWYGNIEAGVFLEEGEFVGDTFEEELRNFFVEIDARSYALTTEVYEELAILSKDNADLNRQQSKQKKRFSTKRKLPKLEPLTLVTKRTRQERGKDNFLKEWYETLQILRDIGEKVSLDQYRPDWVTDVVPVGVQADQFLHAFYYGQVKGTKLTHWDRHATNRKDPGRALIDAMNWWSNLDSPPHDEDVTMYEWSVYLQDKLSKENLLGLSREDFVQVCFRVHAMKEHSLRVSYKSYGLHKPLPEMNAAERVSYLGGWLYDYRNAKNQGVLATLEHVLYGGDRDRVPERIWEATTTEDYKISHLGISSIGEIVGWALPQSFPPRNGRTSKALVSLGYNVEVYSE